MLFPVFILDTNSDVGGAFITLAIGSELASAPMSCPIKLYMTAAEPVSVGCYPEP